MKKFLFIAEKPSLMQNVRGIYNKHKHEFDMEIDFAAQKGHLLELLEPDQLHERFKSWDANLLPINPANEGGWKYRVSKDSKECFYNIKEKLESGEYDAVIHGGDPDQEGELLIRETLMSVKNKLPVYRYWVNAQDERSVLKALKTLELDSSEKYERIYKAALARQRNDYLMGFNCTRAVANKIQAPYGLIIAAGRVMTWVQTQIVKREDEIANYKESVVYGVNDKLTAKGVDFVANLVNDQGEEIFFDKKEDALEVINTLDNQAKVVSFTKTRKKTEPKLLYKLSTLQIDGAKLGISAKRTQDIAESLYMKKYLTYPRTTCEYIGSGEDIEAILYSVDELDEVSGFIATARSNLVEYSKNKRYVNDNKLDGASHSAIVPTGIKPDLSSLTADELTIYKLVAVRFVASMLDPLVYDESVAIINDKNKLFKATGRKVISSGFTELMHLATNYDELPDLEEGKIIPVLSHELREKHSKCPARYTEGSLIKLMENPSKMLEDEELKAKCKNMTIGQPSTRDTIIEKLKRNKYIVANKKGELSPTEFGSAMIHIIGSIDLCKTEMTGKWDLLLREITEGKREFNVVQDEIYNDLLNLLEQIKALDGTNMGGSERVPEVAIGLCSCGGELMMGAKRFACKKCSAWMPKTYMQVEFDEEAAKKLFNDEALTYEFTSKTGQKMTFPIKLSRDKKSKFPFEKVEDETDKEELNYDCPICKKNKLYAADSYIKCACGFKMKKEICGLQLSDEIIEELLLNQKTTDKVEGFVSPKSGNSFSAVLMLKKDKKYGWGVAFDFAS